MEPVADDDADDDADDAAADGDEKIFAEIPVIIIRAKPTFFGGSRPSFFRPPSFFDRFQL